MTEDPSRRIGDYEILGVLGSGGMGKVFKVRNVISDRIEAMKILLPDLAGRQEVAERFLREIKLLASLDHPNIAQLRTALTLSNRLVMVMEYVEGTTLAARLEKGPIPVEEAIGYARQVLGALTYAHGRNVIHRDIKPANVMLTPRGTAKLMDFGIARAGGDASMTLTGTTVGSLYYMSPEQVKGGAVDARSDLYSLGLSLYEMVTGQRPFKADSDYSLMTAQLQEQPKPPSELRPDLPAQLSGIILHAMAKEPGERFQSAEEFRQALDSFRLGGPPPIAAMKAQPSSAIAMGATSVMAGGAVVEPSMGGASHPPLMPTLPAAIVMEMPHQYTKSRGLYMALGAVVVLIVLVLAGLSFPRWLKTRANEQKQNSGQSVSGQGASQTPDTNPASPPAPDSGGSTPPNSAASDSGKSPDAGTQPSPDSGASGSTQPPGSATPSDVNASGSAGSDSSVPASRTTSGTETGRSANSRKPVKSRPSLADSSTTVPSAAVPEVDQGAKGSDATQTAEPIEELEQDVDQTSSRATVVSDSLGNIRRQLSAQGLNLRGDIAVAEETMKVNLDKARQALQNGDTKNARRYLNIAQAQTEKIEKFLGH